MDSINRNQPEENRKNLVGKEATDKIIELADKAGSCFFCTAITTGKAFQTRPMSPQKIDDTGNIWFLSPSDSDKNEEIKKDRHIQLIFQGSSYSDFLSLYGEGTISTDRIKIKELWQPQLKDWFTEGEDDPRITVIRFVPTEGYYWDTKNGKLVSLLKTAVGAVIGKTLDDSIEGTLKV